MLYYRTWSRRNIYILFFFFMWFSRQFFRYKPKAGNSTQLQPTDSPSAKTSSHVPRAKGETRSQLVHASERVAVLTSTTASATGSRPTSSLQLSPAPCQLLKQQCGPKAPNYAGNARRPISKIKRKHNMHACVSQGRLQGRSGPKNLPNAEDSQRVGRNWSMEPKYHRTAWYTLREMDRHRRCF